MIKLFYNTKRGSFLKKHYIEPIVEYFYYDTKDCLNGSQTRENSAFAIDDFKDFDPNEWDKLY